MKPYEEHHFRDIEDVGVAFNHDRVWVCINGQALLRAKVINGGLFVTYDVPRNLQEKLVGEANRRTD